MLKPLHEMDPELVRKLLEGHADVISPAVAQEQADLVGFDCPFCHSPTTARVNPKRPFSNGKILPNKVLICLKCGAEIDPNSRLIMKMPTGESD